jgi:hypothetical protein
MRILFALLAIGIGGSLVLAGYRLARFIIPLWGFVAGLAVGGDVISSMQHTPFLGTVLGVLVGLALGALFAALAYLYYSIAIVILVGAAGYWLGSNTILLFGFDPGLLSVIIGSALGILFGIVALIYNVPKYFLIVISAIAGATAAVGGILLLFNQISLDSFSYATINQALSNSFFWTLLAIVLTLAGILIQTVTTHGYNYEAWRTNTVGDDGQGLPTHP